MARESIVAALVLILAVAAGTTSARTLQQQQPLDLGSVIQGVVGAVTPIFNATTTALQNAANTASLPNATAPNGTAPFGQFLNNITSAVNQTLAPAAAEINQTLTSAGQQLNQTVGSANLPGLGPLNRTAEGNNVTNPLAALGDVFNNITTGLTNLTQQTLGNGSQLGAQNGAGGASSREAQFPRPDSSATGNAARPLVGFLIGALALLLL